MRELVEISGLSKGAFYHYFKSKEELFIEVIDAYFLVGPEKIYKSLVDSPSLKDFYLGYVQNLAGFMDYLINSCEMEGLKEGPITYYYMAFDAITRFPEFREKISNYHIREFALWKNTIANARKSGEIDTPLSDDHLSKLFVSTIDRIAVPLLLEGRIDELHKEVLSLWNGLYNVIKR